MRTRHQTGSNGSLRSQRFAASLLVGMRVAMLVGCSSERPLTDYQIRNRLQEVDDAIVAADPDRVVSFLAPDAVIQSTTHVYGGARTDTLDPSGYRAALAETFEAVDEYEYQRTTKHIEISEDGNSATVESFVLEGVHHHGRWLRTKTRETATFERREAEGLVVTKVVGDSIIYEGTLENTVFWE